MAELVSKTRCGRSSRTARVRPRFPDGDEYLRAESLAEMQGPGLRRRPETDADVLERAWTGRGVGRGLAR